MTMTHRFLFLKRKTRKKLTIRARGCQSLRQCVTGRQKGQRVVVRKVHVPGTPIAVDIPSLRASFSSYLFYFFWSAATTRCGNDPSYPEQSVVFRDKKIRTRTFTTPSVSLILAKASAMKVTIPLDLSTRPFIPLPRFFHSVRTIA